MRLLLALVLAVPLAAPFLRAGDVRGRVGLIETPDGGIQPQALIDAQGATHLIWFKGDPGAGDVYYKFVEPNAARFEPLRVNSVEKSAVATGAVRGPQIALGKNGRVHVAWNGSGRVADSSGMLSTRLADDRKSFEPQRDLMTITTDLDGGGTVAADGAGNVLVAWHAPKKGGEPGEEHAQVWVARSSDDGKTFATETPAWTKATGACGCCSMHAFATGDGAFAVMYRSANAAVNRDVWLLASKDAGKTFEGAMVQPWKVAGCPMSTMASASIPVGAPNPKGATGSIAAWETDGQVWFAHVKSGSTDVATPIAAPGSAKSRKHPAIAVAKSGDVLLAWTEGTGWDKGGDLVWQVFDAAGKPTDDKGRIDGGIPKWSFPAAVALGDDNFRIFH